MMEFKLPPPGCCAITSGATTKQTTPDDLEFVYILLQVEVAVLIGLSYFQIREKNLPVRMLYELVSRAAQHTRGSLTRLLVNDRFDVAQAAGADGVHLTSTSLPPQIVRKVCGPQFVIGVSTHSLDEARAARDGGADFIVFGPVFDTESKRAFGPAQGLDKLGEVTSALQGFPVLAIGGVNLDNYESCLARGASGFAGISWFSG